MKKLLLGLLLLTLIINAGCVKITPLDDGAFKVEPDLQQKDLETFKTIGKGFLKSYIETPQPMTGGITTTQGVGLLNSNQTK